MEDATSELAVIDRGIALLTSAVSYDSANSISDHVLRPIAKGINAQAFERIARVAVSDSQVKGAYSTPPLIATIRDAGTIDSATFRRIADEQGLSRVFPGPVGIEIATIAAATETAAADDDDFPF